MSKVSFIKSSYRYYNIERCLSLIKSEIVAGVKNAQRVVIKPNCVTDNVKLAATHATALRALLEFILPYAKSQITIAEGSGMGDTLTAFRNFGYLKLQDEFDFTIVDLNDDDFEIIELADKDGKIWPAQVAKTVLESDYLISITPPKTHDSVVYTGAIKNVAVGSLLRPGINFSQKIASKLGLSKNSKAMIHQGPKAINENIKRLYEKIPLKLAVIDAFEAMEGDGPIEGNMVPCHHAIVSSDPLAADSFACRMMGISTKDVGYLSLLGADKRDYFIVGDTWQEEIIQFEMHKNFEQIRHWQ